MIDIISAVPRFVGDGVNYFLRRDFQVTALLLDQHAGGFFNVFGMQLKLRAKQGAVLGVDI